MATDSHKPHSVTLHGLRQMLADEALSTAERAERAPHETASRKSRLFGRADGIDFALSLIDRAISEAES